MSSQSLREAAAYAAAEALWGTGVVPFNKATGFTVRHESYLVADAVLGVVLEQVTTTIEALRRETLDGADADDDLGAHLGWARHDRVKATGMGEALAAVRRLGDTP